jgi:hypothetical protein
MALANELQVLDDEVTDKEVIKKMLHSILEKLEQVAISMETLLNLNSLSIEEAAGHLRVVEQRKKGPSSPAADTGDRLLLIEEEWIAQMKAKVKNGSNGGSSSNGGANRGHGRGRGRGHGDGCNGGANSNSPQEGVGYGALPQLWQDGALG